MLDKEFQEILERQLDRIKSVLASKGAEYATEDRLSNFKTAASLQGKTLSQALGGMMAKHTVSIYDMIETGEVYPHSVWDEKITDHLNYLILLKAVLIEQDDKIDPV